MSNKSRQDKTKTPAQTSAPPPTSNDIIPGRFTEADWYHMVDQEDGEEFVVDIVNEIVESTMKVLHDQYIISQTLPYTIQESKNLLLQIIEWQFLACDGGENNPACDATWLEEDEPVTPLTDSWAQGSVPIMLRPSSASSVSSIQSDRESELSSVAEERPGAPEPPFEALDVPETPLSISSPAQPTPATAEKRKENKPQELSKKQVQGKKKTYSPFRPHKGKLPSFSGVDLTPLTDEYSLRTAERLQEVTIGHRDTTGLTMLSSSTSILKFPSENSRLEECYFWSSTPSSYSQSWRTTSNYSKSQAQYGRPPGIKDVLYDERGNVVAVMKISPDKLPSHRVRTKFSVVDDDNDMQVVRSRTRPRKYGQNPRKMEATKDLKASKNASLKQNIDASSINNASYQTENAGYITPLPPPLVDAMDISAGVLVREGNIIRRGPRQIPRRAEKTPSSACLQPLDSTRTAGRVIDDILTRSSPVIRPLHATEPIPPITSQPPTYS
ncbi:hypothetical protein pdam_00017783 [Pocillopora damicornis]|uniref:Uncharacterized protein n=1 Tax=Pocillopora damicornis TaxID=46731 RepID=A0A3M6UNW0_POCDA|nr:uncharacterized protein C2orf81-like isoform X1 [Pocillopora damicornis]RMX55289.1 hypothetical protein pdam_00017783 [Pocillopora damicornis]